MCTRICWLVFILVMQCVTTPEAHSQSLSIQIYDQENRPLADAVVEIISPTAAIVNSGIQHVAQEQLTFVPFVTATPKGSLIDFPNRDKTRHHVYSFSSAKTFEIELYTGKPEEPVLFDEPGIVVLGCNIHDYMLAYIYVGESPLLLVTDENGKVYFPEVPQETLRIKLWHPWQLEQQTEQVVSAPLKTELSFTLAVAAKEKPRPPKRGFGS